MAEKKINNKEIGKKIVDLKIELLKNPTKRGSIKKEIARLLTMRNESEVESPKLREKTSRGKKIVKTKLAEGRK